MRQILLSLIFLAAAFAPAAAQTKTAEPRAADARSARSEANATRSRIVVPRVENHAAKPSLTGRQTSAAPKLIQKTSLVTPSPFAPVTSAPARANVSSMSLPAPATSALYRVGVGDVLDIRLASMPTRESTLFTVLRNGTI